MKSGAKPIKNSSKRETPTPVKKATKDEGGAVTKNCFATSAHMIPPEPSKVPLPKFNDDFDDGDEVS